MRIKCQFYNPISQMYLISNWSKHKLGDPTFKWFWPTLESKTKILGYLGHIRTS